MKGSEMSNIHAIASEYLSSTKDALRGSGYANKALGVTEAIMSSRHRDSDNLQNSNFDYMVKQLTKLIGEEDDEISRGEFSGISNWHIESFNHWLVGWVEYIVVKVYNSDNETTEAFNLMHDFNRAIEDYPVLDEEDYSEREYNDLINYLKFEIASIDRCSEVGLVNPNEDSHEAIASKVCSELNSSSVEDIRSGMIESILFDLGYTDYPVYVVTLSTPGYLPDSVSYFEDEDTARTHMEDIVRELRDDMELPNEPINRLLNIHHIDGDRFNPYSLGSCVEFTETTLSDLGVESFNEFYD